ncbi:MAG TPA: DUF3137 domain-containing protein [Flavisolibacter sp.]|nr:DUF3137 domain-containing protein [Flavisolibacter sp.]
MKTIVEPVDRQLLGTAAQPREDFDEVYVRIKNSLKSLEKQRLKVVLLRMFGIILPFILFIANCAYFHHLPSIVISFICLIVGLFWNIPVSDKYKVAYKKLVVKELMAHCFPALTYKADRFIMEKVFRLSRLFENKVSEYTGEDLIEGNTKSWTFAFSEVKAKEYQNVDRKKRIYKIFSGVFLQATCVADSTNELVIYPRSIDFWMEEQYKVIEVNNEAFQKKFTFYSRNGRFDSRIKPSTLTDAITKLRQYTKATIYMALSGSTLYMAINKSFFEPTYIISNTNKKHLYRSYVLVKQLVNFVEQLDLDTDANIA